MRKRKLDKGEGEENNGNHWGAEKYFHKSAQLRYIVRAISGSWPLKKKPDEGIFSPSYHHFSP